MASLIDGRDAGQDVGSPRGSLAFRFFCLLASIALRGMATVEVTNNHLHKMESPAPQLILFARGVIAILNAWPVLRIAVQESWGGPQAAEKRTWIVSTLVDAFEASPLDEEEVEDLLLEAMADEFETEVDDGSSQVVAKNILAAWNAACNGETEVVLRFEATAERLTKQHLSTSRQGGNGDDEWVDEEISDEDREGDDPPPQLIKARSSQVAEPVIDNDGFQLIQKSGKRKGH